MIRVGILPSKQNNESDNPYDDTHRFFDQVINKIYDFGGIPIGLLLNKGELNQDSLKLCDAFVISGGKKIEPFLLDVINFAKTNNKPLLGICLGMQTIAVYSYLEDMCKKDNILITKDNIKSKFEEIKREKVFFLKPVDGHYNEKITKNNYEKNSHKVKIKENTKLYKILGTDEINVISLHRYSVNLLGIDVLISATKDDVIEGIEYRDPNIFIIGVQWHPELDDKSNQLFIALMDEAKRRKNEL